MEEKAIGPADAADIAALIRSAFAAQEVATDPPPSAARVRAEDILAHLDAGGGGAMILDHGTPVASVLWNSAEGFYISRVAVDRRARRRGLGWRLLTLAEKAARAAGKPAMTLETRLTLPGNRRLFEAFGFHEISRHAHPGYAEPTFMRMEKPLSGPMHGMGSPGDRA